MITISMKENIQEISFCYQSLTAFQSNVSGIEHFYMFLDEFFVLNMKKSTHKK